MAEAMCINNNVQYHAVGLRSIRYVYASGDSDVSGPDKEGNVRSCDRMIQRNPIRETKTRHSKKRTNENRKGSSVVHSTEYAVDDQLRIFLVEGHRVSTLFG